LYQLLAPLMRDSVDPATDDLPAEFAPPVDS